MNPAPERAPTVGALRTFGHESRNLIQSALWPIERALAEPGAPPEVVAALRESCQKLVQLLTVVDDHVVGAQLAAGVLHADVRALDLVEGVEDLVLTLERLFPVPIRWVRPRRAAVRPRVLADSDGLTVILRLLLLGALTSQLRARPARAAQPVEVRVRAAGRRAWAVEVRDTGPDTAARVAAWRRGSRRAPGGGLALALALARSLDGDLVVAPRATDTVVTASVGFRLILPRGGHD